jgi:hypothetical protein
LTQPEPLHFAIAHHLFEDVQATMVQWQADLDERRRRVVEDFGAELSVLRANSGETYADQAEAKIDAALGRWCEMRGAFAQGFVSALYPGTVAVAEQIGTTAQLGQLLGIHLDNAIRDLDQDLRRAAGIAG